MRSEVVVNTGGAGRSPGVSDVAGSPSPGLLDGDFHCDPESVSGGAVMELGLCVDISSDREGRAADTEEISSAGGATGSSGDKAADFVFRAIRCGSSTDSGIGMMVGEGARVIVKASSMGGSPTS